MGTAEEPCTNTHRLWATATQLGIHYVIKAKNAKNCLFVHSQRLLPDLTLKLPTHASRHHWLGSKRSSGARARGTRACSPCHASQKRSAERRRTCTCGSGSARRAAAAAAPAPRSRRRPAASQPRRACRCQGSSPAAQVWQARAAAASASADRAAGPPAGLPASLQGSRPAPASRAAGSRAAASAARPSSGPHSHGGIVAGGEAAGSASAAGAGGGAAGAAPASSRTLVRKALPQSTCWGSASAPLASLPAVLLPAPGPWRGARRAASAAAAADPAGAAPGCSACAMLRGQNALALQRALTPRSVPVAPASSAARSSCSHSCASAPGSRSQVLLWHRLCALTSGRPHHRRPHHPAAAVCSCCATGRGAAPPPAAEPCSPWRAPQAKHSNAAVCLGLRQGCACLLNRAWAQAKRQPRTGCVHHLACETQAVQPVLASDASFDAQSTLMGHSH